MRSLLRDISHRHGEVSRMRVDLMAVLFLHRNDAAVGDFADGVFELNGRVADAEVVMQQILYVFQYPLAHRGRNVGDRDVARQGAGL